MDSEVRGSRFTLWVRNPTTKHCFFVPGCITGEIGVIFKLLQCLFNYSTGLFERLMFATLVNEFWTHESGYLLFQLATMKIWADLMFLKKKSR